ncbi:ligand-binding protein SH3 [Brevibacterium luteolum]|uniref:ligand-binding protein SH3 n=1 Tax=Brevibacterium luteolum TaxID=199591 RepID=UPI00223AEDBA|nr:ligand-binding protein SH3 [Brevibacterium luteolum]MCT1829431.1 ligand-binding protein SH3 [Brevibacterium luteolum]MCT1890658.1 ligand-binding protein SH3 [Brevibacterium luteolum]MCT1922546.1 ligand-binding protein SH3 [Brevibacterium luteolum]MCT1924299.1 ligand-binding protein SH3 [Brevibacterium luteolum]
MGKHSDPNQSSWASSARTLVRDLSRVGRSGSGRHSADQASTATGVIKTIKRKPMVAAIAIPAAATTAIVASSFALGPNSESGVVKTEQQAASSPVPEEDISLVDEDALNQQREEAAKAYEEGLKDNKDYQSKSGAVSATTPKPEPKPTAASSSSSKSTTKRGGDDTASRSKGRDTSVSYEACSVSSSIESGLQPVAVNGYRAICANFPEVKSYGGHRNQAGSDHNSGMAVDAMIRGSVGDQITKFLIDNRQELNVKYVIWEQKYYASTNGWKGKPMENRGGDTANHYDHVHVSFK